jgi:hypothetical protein
MLLSRVASKSREGKKKEGGGVGERAGSECSSELGGDLLDWVVLLNLRPLFGV